MLAGDLQRLDSRPLSAAPDELRAFLVVRNELARLPASLDHHRALGVQRFFVIDNNSNDASVDYLLQQPDVHLFHTSANYCEARLGIDWIEALLNGHGVSHWCLILDGDEHLVYPDCESTGLGEFTAGLEAAGLNCLATLFLDMYSDRPIARTSAGAADTMLDVCPFFDRNGYFQFSPAGSCFPRLYGGPRARIFWPELDLARQAAAPHSYVERSFDEQAYLSIHPDVGSAVAAGELQSALEHFIRYGHIEGRPVSVRSLPDWPEDRYLALHTDVNDSVRSGVFTSGLEHYLRYGQFEGRRLWAAGPPCMSQVPLVKWRSDMRYNVGRHSLLGGVWQSSQVVGGALLHFKLLADMSPRAATISEQRRQDSDPAWRQENERYCEILRRNPLLSAWGRQSVRYRNSQQLVELGLVRHARELMHA